MNRITHALLCCVAVSFIHSPVFAQNEEATENSGGIIQRYGRNAANGISSVIADRNSSALLLNYSSVTDELLQNPPDADWVTWRRTHNNQGFSNLDQINRGNVADLELAWNQLVTVGNNMPTPLVHDGIMFLYSAGDVVLALDATNGEMLWRYSHDSEVATSHKFGIALHENKVLLPTSDFHMVALDARSREVIWDHAIEI